MIKKILGVIVIMIAVMVFGFSFGFVGVSADDQGVSVNVSGTTNFTLVTTSLDYGNVASGDTSLPQITKVTLGENNNVNIKLEIQLKDDSDSIFENIYYDLKVDPGYESKLSKTEKVSTVLTDSGLGSQSFDLMSVIKILAGTAPSTGKTGTVIFTATDVNTPPAG